MYVCRYVGVYVCTYVRSYVRMYVRTYVCMYIHMYRAVHVATIVHNICTYVGYGKKSKKKNAKSFQGM